MHQMDGGMHASYNILFKEVSGESKCETQKLTASCEETSLPTILSGYDLRIYISHSCFRLRLECPAGCFFICQYFLLETTLFTLRTGLFCTFFNQRIPQEHCIFCL